MGPSESFNFELTKYSLTNVTQNANIFNSNKLQIKWVRRRTLTGQSADVDSNSFPSKAPRPTYAVNVVLSISERKNYDMEDLA